MTISDLTAIARHYYDLGFTSFGGPGVHVLILRHRFVETLKWVDETTFLDLFALGNALPGPGSTQLAFSIAVVTHGVAAGIFAFLLWSLPGAAGMAGLAVGITRIPDRLPPIVLALLTGLNAAAVGLIALAAVQLATAAATDRLTVLLLWLSASFGICYHAPWMYPTLIAAGGLATFGWDFRRQAWRRLRRKREVHDIPLTAPNGGQNGTPNGSTPSLTHSGQVEDQPEPARPALMVVSVPVIISLLLGFALFLTVPLATRAGLQNAGRSVPRLLDFFANMVVAGTIIFGGGPVVIPLLRDYVVAEGWVSSRDFLLVFAILQAFPGPNFNFAVALGVLAVPSNRAAGAVAAFIGIFGPGIVLKLALLPVYGKWREHPVLRSVIRGLNASASGLVFTAVWQLFLVGYIYQPAEGRTEQTVSGPLTSSPFWAVVSSGAFVACRTFSVPAWGSVIGGGLAGLAWFGVTSR